MNTDTPETDKYADADWWTLFRATEHCRKLERERDEAKEQRDALAEALRVATACPLTDIWFKQAIDALATLKPCD